jgi:hypothetical protein
MTEHWYERDAEKDVSGRVRIDEEGSSDEKVKIIRARACLASRLNFDASLIGMLLPRIMTKVP